jgi:hypothetical protein
VPVEGVVNALRAIHAVLTPGGLVVDTQPVSSDPVVEADARELGRLDMREWGRSIELIDERFEVAYEEQLFEVREERIFVVTELFGDAAEALTMIRNWDGTRIPAALEQRIAHSRGPVQVHQDIRLRLLRAL